MPYFQNNFGVGYKLEDHLVFFGNQRFDSDAFSSEFPQLVFRRVRQTHSDIIIESSETITEADAHFTGVHLCAPVVATADCIPLMIYCRTTRRVAAVHAGWKGVQNQIIAKTLQRFLSSGSRAEGLFFYVGPHIRQQSFETDEDVFIAMTAAHPGLATEKFLSRRGAKYLIDLNTLMRFQIEMTLNLAPLIADVDIDTVKNTVFHSYRRDKAASGRNLNFIVLI